MIRAKEMMQMKKVLSDSGFRANPLVAVKQHLDANISALQEEREQYGSVGSGAVDGSDEEEDMW